LLLCALLILNSSLNTPIAQKQQLIVHFLRYGPYHLARLVSAWNVLASLGWDVVGLETASQDSTYAWETSDEDTQVQRITVFPDCIAEDISPHSVRQGVINTLDRLQPAALAIAGWSQPDALACLSWCRRHGAKAILMSETREADGERIWLKEFLKARRVCRFGAALVGGRSHQTYLRKLGFKAPISFGYNVVDDCYFAAQAERWRLAERATDPQPRPYLLASNRFVARKNLFGLVQAFAVAASRRRPLVIQTAPISDWWALALSGLPSPYLWPPGSFCC
jgi:1,2-diacylglycerol 3-alpha-glucosyltransferase